jgi:serine/threonine-protein kinase
MGHHTSPPRAAGTPQVDAGVRNRASFPGCSARSNLDRPEKRMLRRLMSFDLHGPLAERYRLDREIGRGGMATVYLAEDLRHNRRVAIKVLNPELVAIAGGERFLQEIQILARLSHPNILPLHDSGSSLGRPCYVMPFIEGESLRQRLDREGALPVEDVLRIADELCSALAYAHSNGVVHRDIKPENILLAAGHAVVSDFGIARAVNTAAGDGLTQTGITLGTPAYMSPEQATGDVVDARSDIYAVGCILYEALTGQVPFPATSQAQAIAKRLTEDPPSARPLRDTVPPLLDQVIQRCMARNPADRFSSATELRRALRPTDSGAHLWGAAPRAARKKAILPVAALVMLVVAVTLFALRPEAESTLPADRLVVFPFTVGGDESLAYLGEGMVDLLSRNLDGAEGLRTVDAGTVLTALAAHDGPAVNEQVYRTVAGRVGGGAYVSGSVYAVGGQVRMQARWRALEGTADESQVITAEGAASNVFDVIDELATRLLASRGRNASGLVETAAITTRSVEALKAFVSAEHTLRLGPQFVDSAIAGFRRATEVDSTFALAYYRQAVAADWNGRRAIAARASQQALVHAERLGDKDRRLLTAYAAYRAGAADEAERSYRALIRDYPDDLEAQFQLADLMVVYNPLRGRPLDEPRQIFERVLAYDPGFL